MRSLPAMFRLASFLILLAILSGCAERGMLQPGSPARDSTLHDIWVANFRPITPPISGQRLPPRPEGLRYERITVSVPASHQPGQIEWPQGAPSGQRDFVTVETEDLPSARRFATRIAGADIDGTDTTLLFVHGFNQTHGEAVYQTAQIAHDFDIRSPMALFSWPSAGHPFGYLYDRDSALIARDALEQVIVALASQPGRKLEILGHSMGNLLIMETLRQIEISGSLDIRARISALIMVSPDIDGELFYTQASRLEQLPRNTVILAARQDRALRLVASLTGRTNRLGSDTDRAAVRDLPVVVVDTSDFTADGSSHSVPMTSPSAIAIIRKARENPPPLNNPISRVINLATLR